MFWTTIKRIIKAGFINFWRNGSVSLSAIFVMIIALSIITATILTTAFLGTALKELQDKIDINVYLVQSAQESSIMDLKDRLETLPEVKEIAYVSREQALEQFRARHENDQRILQALEEVGENPLTAVLNIKAKEPSQYAGIAAFLGGRAASGGVLSIIDKVNYNDNKVAIERLVRVIAGVKKLGSFFTIVMVGISVLITFNTIRLAIFIAREEIGIMRLVGGSRGYIRGPFVVEGVMYGFVAGFLTLVIFYPVTYWFRNTTQGFYGGVDLQHYFVANFLEISSIVILSGVVLGAVSSYLAVRKYLNN